MNLNRMRGVLGEAPLVRGCSQKRKPYTEMKTNGFCLMGDVIPRGHRRGPGARLTSTPAPAAGAPGASSLAAGGSWGLVLSAEWDRNLHLSRPPEPSTACDFRKMADFWMGWEQKVEFHHGLTTHRVACCREAVRGPGFPWQHPETLIPCVVL